MQTIQKKANADEVRAHYGSLKNDPLSFLSQKKKIPCSNFKVTMHHQSLLLLCNLLCCLPQHLHKNTEHTLGTPSVAKYQCKMEINKALFALLIFSFAIGESLATTITHCKCMNDIVPKKRVSSKKKWLSG